MILLCIKARSALVYSNGASQLARIIATFSRLANGTEVSTIMHGNTVVEAVRDEDVVVTVQGDAMRPVEPRLMALPVGTTGMAGAASNRRDAAACGNADLADTRVVV